MITILNGDSAVLLKDIADNSIDSVVTDPPYGLSFMNKHWDYDVPSIDIWEEVLRVLKPGGHLLSFGGTRTYHRMVVNIEDAGFEIRDQIQWLYGSGFPKSLNIGKAVDGLQGNEREVVDTGKTIPDIRSNNYENSQGKVRLNETISKGYSEWEGWGTALKPANEPICLARKPISENTIAENVLKWGTGGINIDGCRVELINGVDDGQLRTMNRSVKKEEDGWGMNNTQSDMPQVVSPQGRFPANVIHDGSEEVVSKFPISSSSPFNGKLDSNNIYGQYNFNKTSGGYADEGSASRFFYCAKASKSERNKGLDSNNHPTVKPIALMRYLCKLITPPKGTVLDPFMGSGSTGIGAKLEGFSFVGIEREVEYCKISQARIDAYEEDKPPKVNTTELTLF